MTIRTALSTAAIALAMTACQQKGYHVKGTALGLNDGDTLYLATDLENLQPLDSFYVKDGKFTYSAESDTVQLALLYSSKMDATAMFFTEPGTITVTLSTEPSQTHVGGTKSNDAWQELAVLSNSYGEKAQSKVEQLYSDSVSEAESQQIFAEMQALEQELQQKIVELTEKNIDNEMGYFIMANLSTDDKTFTPEKCQELIERMPTKMRQRPAIVNLEQELKKSEPVTVGKPITDFTLPTPEGAELSVMSEVAKNKITILDFWASWCGPCRQEMPFMKELYAKYNAKGLGIVGISLDEDREAWINGITELGITWPQMSDLKGWQSEAGKLFQVNSIPFMVIVDQQGIILAKGLRGENLSDFISSQLNMQ